MLHDHNCFNQMTQRTPFNVNDTVRVRLTDTGRRVLRENHKRLFEGTFRPPLYESPEEVDGWSTWVLWRLMQEFGHACGMGFDVPFEVTIEIEWPEEQP